VLVSYPADFSRVCSADGVLDGIPTFEGLLLATQEDMGAGPLTHGPCASEERRHV